MDVISTTRPKTEGDLIAFELDRGFTRKRGTVLAGSGATRAVAQFALLGLITVGALSVTSALAGTGNGTVSNLAVAAGTKPGKWVAQCIEPAANAGVFELSDPDGVSCGTILVGTAFNIGGLSGTINDGATDFVSGDRYTFTVTAAAGSGKLLPWSPTATDGTQNVSGVTLHAYTVPDGEDLDITYIENGPVILKAESIAWPAGVTDAQKAAALAQLRALMIKVDTL